MGDTVRDPLHVVVVDGDVSFPATSGKRLRTLHLMVRLAARHRVTYIARGNGEVEADDRARAFFTERGIRPIIVPDPTPRKRGGIFYARLAANLASPLPYSVASFRCPRVRQAVAQYAAANLVDLWQFEWFPFLRFVPPSPVSRRVIVAHNVESLIWQRYWEAEARPLRRWYIRQQWQKFERCEREVFAEADRVVAVSPDDAHLVRTRLGMDRVAVVENGVDARFYAATDVRERDPARILFLGSLEWRPNLDAVGLLLDRIFPAIRAQVPAARLWVVGRNPPPALSRRVRQTVGAELHADVPDVRPFLGASGVMVVPLRIGGGSRLKILESLAAGLPVVSTRVGAEGLDLVPGRHLTVVDGPNDVATAVVECLQRPEAFRRLAEEGQQVVRERYDWDALACRLDAVWRACMATGASGARPTGARPDPAEFRGCLAGSVPDNARKVE